MSAHKVKPADGNCALHNILQEAFTSVLLTAYRQKHDYYTQTIHGRTGRGYNGPVATNHDRPK